VRCRPGRAGLVRSSILCPGSQKDRSAEVWLLHTGPDHGGKPAGWQLMLTESARYPYLAQALISPDGQMVTAMVLTGPKVGQNPGGPGVVPDNLTVEQIAVPSGRPLRVLYRRHLGSTFETSIAPDFLSLTRDASGQHWIVIAGVYHPFSGRLDHGRLIHISGLNEPGFEAW